MQPFIGGIIVCSFFFFFQLKTRKQPTKAHQKCYKPNDITKVGTISGNPEKRKKNNYKILLFKKKKKPLKETLI